MAGPPNKAWVKARSGAGNRVLNAVPGTKDKTADKFMLVGTGKPGAWYPFSSGFPAILYPVPVFGGNSRFRHK